MPSSAETWRAQALAERSGFEDMSISLTVNGGFCCTVYPCSWNID